MCLSLGDVMNEMAGRCLFVCALFRFVKDQDLDKATTKVLKTFDGKCRAKGWNCESYLQHRTDVLAFLPTRFGKSLLFQLIPGLCVELHNLGYRFFL